MKRIVLPVLLLCAAPLLPHETLSVGLDVRMDFGHLLPRAELKELAAGLRRRYVTRTHVVGVAALVDLVVVGVVDRDLAGEEITPVRARAAIVGQALEQLDQGMTLPDRDELDGVVVQIAAGVKGRTRLLNVRCALLGDLRHGIPLSWSCVYDARSEQSF